MNPASRAGHGDVARWPWWVAAGLAVTGVVVNVARPTAPPLPPGLPDAARFDPALLATIAEYRGPRLAWLPVLILLPLVVAWWLARPRGRLTRLASAWDERVGWRRVLAAAGVAAGVAAAASLSVLPIRAYLGLIHEQRWGFRTSTTLGWWRDAAVVSVGGWLTVAVVVVLIVVAARRWPRSWPARLTIGVAGVAYAVVLLHPVLLQPLLLTTEPLSDGPLRDRLEEVTTAAEVDVPLVVADASRRTTRFNAVVVGLGPTERVVLFDTLLELPDDQIVALVAHELAHQQHRDLLRGTALAPTAVLPAALLWQLVAGRRRRGDPTASSRVALVPLLVAVGLTAEVVTGPVVAGLSRRVEAAADQASYELGADPATTVALLRTGVVRDLADPDPPRWLRLAFATHPSPRDRIRAAAAAARRTGTSLPDADDYADAEREVRHPRVGAAGEGEP